MTDERKKYRIIFKVETANREEYWNPQFVSKMLLDICKKNDLTVVEMHTKHYLFRSHIIIIATKEDYTKLYKKLCKKNQYIKIVSPYKP